MNKMLFSALLTPDGTVIRSRHRHDFVRHQDQNGEEYFLDGGCDYIRTSVNKEQGEHLTITMDDDICVVREWLDWGTYGIAGDEPLHYVKLMDMDIGHIQTLLNPDMKIPMQSELRFFMEEELEYRKDYGL
jgi:hypothetical protein